MSKTPRRDVVFKTKPVGIVRSQPFAEAQKTSVGAIPPSHVEPSVKSPEARTRHMIESNVTPSLLPGRRPYVKGPLILEPNVTKLPLPTSGPVDAHVNTCVFVPTNRPPDKIVKMLSD